MKRLACVMVFVLLTFCFAVTSEAGVWGADYPYSPDTSMVWDRYSWDYSNHAVVNWNNTVGTAQQMIMNSNGQPWLYYWGDFYTYYVDIYYSYDGYYWYYYGTVYY